MVKKLGDTAQKQECIHLVQPPSFALFLQYSVQCIGHYSNQHVEQ